MRLGLASSPECGIWPATILAFLFGFLFRLTSLRLGWQEPEPWAQQRLHEGNEAFVAAPEQGKAS